MKLFRAILLTVALSGAGGLRAELADAIKAVVHDSVITSQEVEFPALGLVDDLRRKYSSQPDVFEKEFNKILEENQDRLIERELILREFDAAGYKFPESAVEERVQERIRKDFLGDRGRLIKTLQAQGVTYEKFRQQIREGMILSALTEKFVSREIIISPHRIETYYLAHKEEYKLDEQVKLRMIVLGVATPADAPNVKKIAEEIITKIKGGAAFAEMADVYSQGRSPGGDRGWVQKYSADGKLVLRKELADVAFTLKPGELSDVVETPEALYLLLVEDKRPAHLKGLSEVREQIENEMIGQERNRLRKQWIDQLKKKTFVRYF